MGGNTHQTYTAGSRSIRHQCIVSVSSETSQSERYCTLSCIYVRHSHKFSLRNDVSIKCTFLRNTEAISCLKYIICYMRAFCIFVYAGFFSFVWFLLMSLSCLFFLW